MTALGCKMQILRSNLSSAIKFAGGSPACSYLSGLKEGAKSKDSPIIQILLLATFGAMQMQPITQHLAPLDEISVVLNSLCGTPTSYPWCCANANSNSSLFL